MEIRVEYAGSNTKAKNEFVIALLELVKEREKSYNYPTDRENRLAIKEDINNIVRKVIRSYYDNK